MKLCNNNVREWSPKSVGWHSVFDNGIYHWNPTNQQAAVQSTRCSMNSSLLGGKPAVREVTMKKQYYFGGIPGPLTVVLVKVYMRPFLKMNRLFHCWWGIPPKYYQNTVSIGSCNMFLAKHWNSSRHFEAMKTWFPLDLLTKNNS